jgi:Ras-related protein Rab-1A
MNPDFDYVFKVLLIGDSGVGKSSILMRFTEDKFEENVITTIGVDSKPKTVEIDGKRVKLNIWDTAGQERMGFLTSSYYRGAQGIIIVFDITHGDSYGSIPNWLGEIERYAYEAAVKILVGNKLDLASSRTVTTEKAKAYAKDLGIEYIETSAKTGVNITEAIMQLTKQIKQKKDGQAPALTPPKPSTLNTLDLSSPPEPKKPPKKSCNI